MLALRNIVFGAPKTLLAESGIPVSIVLKMILKHTKDGAFERYSVFSVIVVIGDYIS